MASKTSEEEQISSTTFKYFVSQYFMQNSPLFLPIKFDGKRPIGSKNNLTKKELIEVHKNNQVKLSDGSIYKMIQKATHLELRLKYTKVVCIDVDGILNNGDCCLDDVLNLPIIKELFYDVPYLLSRNKKLPHFYLELTGLNKDEMLDTYVDCFKDFKGDLLLNHSWESLDSQIHGYHVTIPEIGIEEIKHMFKEDALKKRKREPSSPAPSNQEPSSQLDKVIDLIALEYLDNYDSWKKIVWAGKKSGIDVDFMRTISQKSMKYTDEGFDNVWKADMTDLTEGTLRYYAKLSDEETYYKLCPTENLYLDLSVIEKGALHITEVIAPKLKREAVFCNGQWYVYSDTTCLWRMSKNPHHVLVKCVVKHMDYTLSYYSKKLKDITDDEERKRHVAKIGKYTSKYNMVDNKSMCSQLTTHLETRLLDNEFSNKLDANLYQVAFKNGIWDMKENKFKGMFKYEDYLTETIPYDYTPSTEEERTYVKEVLFKICNCNHEHLNYYLSILGHAMTGDADKEKALYFLVGIIGDNGKTLMMDVLATIMPNYVYKIDKKTFEEGFSKAHKYLTRIRGKRIVYAEEMSKKAQNIELLKEYGDGKKIENEIMYGTAESINIVSKLFCLSNNTPNIATDGGIQNRYRQLCFNSNFGKNNTVDDVKNLKFKQDNKLSDKLTGEYKNAVIDLLLEYGHKYTKDGMCEMPEEFKEATNNTLSINDEFRMWYEEFCEIGEEFKCSKTEIENNYKKMDLREMKDEVARLGFKYNSQLKHKGNKGIFLGFRMKEKEPVAL